jgi:hypothetical protein
LNVLTIVALLLGATVSMAAADPGITPDTVERLIYPGESAVVDKTVTTPEIPPKPDIYFLADTTGSMEGAIANVQANAAAILAAVGGVTTDPQFGAGDYKDFPSDPYAFNNAAPIANDGGAGALAAIGAWAAGGGGDGPEGQFFALDQLAEGVANWRADSTKIVVWFGDWPAHDPVCAAISGLSYDITEASLTAKLVAAEIRVIAISTTTGLPLGLDEDPTPYSLDYAGICATIDGSAGQASRIAAATGGVALVNVPPEEVTNAILEGLQNLPAETAMVSDCAAPVSTTFDPASQIVISGEDASFLETISVVAGTAGGTYTCQDWATINGEDMVDETGALITEAKTIHVPGISLTPETDTNELGFVLDHTVTALVSAGDYGPVEGVRVEFDITAGPHTGESGLGATDAAGETDFTYTPAVEPASLGTDTITACFTDPADTVVYGCDTAEKTWQDTTPPTSACTPTVNPAGRHVPNAPGNGGQGQNQDGFYQIWGHDVVWPDEDLEVYVTDMGSGVVFGPFAVYTNIKYTQAPGATPNQKLIGGPGSAVAWHITGTGDAVVTVVDGSGNVSAGATCLVPPKPM